MIKVKIAFQHILKKKISCSILKNMLDIHNGNLKIGVSFKFQA